AGRPLPPASPPARAERRILARRHGGHRVDPRPPRSRRGGLPGPHPVRRDDAAHPAPSLGDRARRRPHPPPRPPDGDPGSPRSRRPAGTLPRLRGPPPAPPPRPREPAAPRP